MTKDSLEKRHQVEKEFHNNKFKDHESSNYYSFGFTSPIFYKMINLVEDMKDKRVLDYGCGEGWLSKILLEKGAEVFSFDISMQAVKNLLSRRPSLKDLHPQVNAVQMAAEYLGFRSESFDYVIGTAILHHLDQLKSAHEIYRVLKKGGKAFFMEPLGHNPVLNWYRRRTPNLRTPDEKPLLFSDFKMYETIFKEVTHEEQYLFVLIALIYYYVFKNKAMTLKMRNALMIFDNAVLRLFPILKKQCWYSIIVLEK